MASIPNITESRNQFNRAFYSMSTIDEKIEAAYNCSIAYEMRGETAFGMIFEQIGNYYWRIRQYGIPHANSKP